jgi:adenosylcobinamide-GDP ribazoletransferase
MNDDPEPSVTFVDWIYSFLAALQYFTRIPIDGLPARTYTDAGKQRSAMLLPLVGVVTGCGTVSLFVLSSYLGLPPLVSAAIAIAGSMLLTGAFHEDGLADFFDSCGATSRERALEVMRDSRIGTFGSAALWASLAIRTFALAAIPMHHLAAGILCAHIIGRTSSLYLAYRLPYARTAPSLNKTMIDVIGARELKVGLLICAVICLATFHGVRLSAVFLILGAAIALFTENIYRTRFGGITGDCLGATNQMIETALLTAATSTYMA